MLGIKLVREKEKRLRTLPLLVGLNSGREQKQPVARGVKWNTTQGVPTGVVDGGQFYCQHLGLLWLPEVLIERLHASFCHGSGSHFGAQPQ